MTERRGRLLVGRRPKPAEAAYIQYRAVPGRGSDRRVVGAAVVSRGRGYSGLASGRFQKV